MVKRAVAKRLLDEKPSVRKEAVDLLGSFVLSKPGLADSYYDELMARILVRAMVPQPVGLFFSGTCCTFSCCLLAYSCVRTSHQTFASA